MTVALIEREPQSDSGVGRTGLRLIVLARIACEEGATRPELARELGALAGAALPARLMIDAELVQLVRSGQAVEARARFTASPVGIERLLAALSLKALPATWAEMRDIRLVAKALGLDHEAASRLKGLARPDVLRAEILAEAFGIKVKGAPSSSRLRAALALVALERAFGNRIKTELSASAGLNAKASRVLAGQLLRKPRDAGTDKRLVAYLAAEAVASAKVDAEHLRAALLRRLASRGGTSRPIVESRLAAVPKADPAPLPPEPVLSPAPAPAPVAEPRGAAGNPGAPARPPAASRPDLAGFVKVVQTAAAKHAEGWPGNRKALVSRVFNAVASLHPGWGLTLVEFKAMLAECHRIGHLALVTADLKDKRLLDELRMSAIAYKNTVWHLVRVED